MIHSEACGAIRVFIIDPFPTILWGLQRLIESTNGTMTLAGTAKNAKNADDDIRKAAPNVILFSTPCIDSSLDSSQLDEVRALSQSVDAKILVLMPRFDLVLQEQAILAGASGVVESAGPPERVLLAITRIHEGEVWVNRASVTRILSEWAHKRSPRLADPEQRKIATLTARERQLVAAFANHPGATAKTIAELLNISEHTARNHLNSVYEKLQVANRVALFDYARRHRLFEPAEVRH